MQSVLFLGQDLEHDPSLQQFATRYRLVEQQTTTSVLADPKSHHAHSCRIVFACVEQSTGTPFEAWVVSRSAHCQAAGLSAADAPTVKAAAAELVCGLCQEVTCMRRVHGAGEAMLNDKSDDGPARSASTQQRRKASIFKGRRFVVAPKDIFSGTRLDVIVMPAAPSRGPSLRQWMDRKGLIQLAPGVDRREQVVRRIVRQVLSALEFLHDLKILHGAVTPENIFFQAAPTAATLRTFDILLVNFRAADSGTRLPTASDDDDGDSDGTDAWSSESSSSSSPRCAPTENDSSDVWSVGALAFELITGQAAKRQPPMLAAVGGRCGGSSCLLFDATASSSRPYYVSQECRHFIERTTSTATVGRLLSIRAALTHAFVAPFYDPEASVPDIDSDLGDGGDGGTGRRNHRRRRDISALKASLLRSIAVALRQKAATTRLPDTACDAEVAPFVAVPEGVVEPHGTAEDPKMPIGSGDAAAGAAEGAEAPVASDAAMGKADDPKAPVGVGAATGEAEDGTADDGEASVSSGASMNTAEGAEAPLGSDGRTVLTALPGAGSPPLTSRAAPFDR